MVSLKPLYNKILLQLEKEKTTAPYIVEPDLQNAVRGIIINVGIKPLKLPPMLQRDCDCGSNLIEQPILQIGQRVYFFIRDARKFKIGENEYYLINDEDILVKEE